MDAGLPRRLWGTVAAGLLILTAGCSPGDGSDEPEPPKSVELEPGIVRAVDLLKVPGLGLMRRLSAAELPNYQGPDLRGPCGRVIKQPKADNRLAAAFVGETATLSQVIVETDGSDAQRLIHDIKEDLRPGCEPQKALTSDGSSQTYTQGPEVEISEIGQDRVATQATLTVDDRTVHLGTILIRSGRMVIHGLVTSESPVESSTIAQLARLMGDATNNLPDATG